jgi:hypothetical protein
VPQTPWLLGFLTLTPDQLRMTRGQVQWQNGARPAPDQSRTRCGIELELESWQQDTVTFDDGATSDD